jgi:hypothetical protein
MESLARTAMRRSFQIAVDGVKLVKKQQTYCNAAVKRRAKVQKGRGPIGMSSRV